MNFQKSFLELEDSFNKEQELLINKFNNIKEKWNELFYFDNQLEILLIEFQDLKKLLKKGNLQILRTKEEYLLSKHA